MTVDFDEPIAATPKPQPESRPEPKQVNDKNLPNMGMSPSEFSQKQKDYLRMRSDALKNAQGRFYIPGKSPGQPYKQDYKRYCYMISKAVKGRVDANGDRFDHFLSNADQKINYYDSTLTGGRNPYNPYGMIAEFDIRILEEDKMVAIRDKM